MKLRDARAVDGVIAALALVVASWPLTTLLRSGEWIRPALLFIGLVAVIGMLGRAAGLRGWLVLAGQLVLTVLTLSWVYGHEHLWYGLPRWETVLHGTDLVADAITTITSFAAPAPVTPGILFATGAALALIAAVVDYLAVTCRSPAMAGMPLLVTFLVSAANSGSSLNPAYFVALALAWLVMLARQGTALLQRWSSVNATPSTPSRDVGADHGVASHAALARSLGVVTLALAVALPALLPHLPPHYLASGLGRGDGAIGGSGTVGFTQTLDLRADLASRSTTPVLTFRTDDPDPPPLRVAATSFYDGRRWRPFAQDTSQVATSPTPSVPAPFGLSRDMPRTQYHLQVESNALQHPQLAVPFPLVGADLGGIDWGQTDNSSVLVARRPSHYDVTYVEVAPSGDVPASLDEPDPVTMPAQDLAVDRASASRVSTLAKQVVGNEKSPLGQAVLIQNYLRDPARFTYSLTLAPPVRGPGGAELDPISHFLVTKRGYCTQFASTMIMMARAEGIPARMGVGFLPGDQDTSGLYQATAAEAHAWPELFIPAMGWTRFEPTPGVRSGEPPSYALRVPDEVAPGGRPVDEQSTATSAPPVAAADKPAPDIPSGSDVPGTAPSVGQRLWQHLPLLLVVVVVGLLGALVVPLAGRHRRGAGLRAARDQREHVEAQWSAFVSRLADYGITAPGLRSPREMQRHYEHAIVLDEDSAKALDRTTLTLEQSRYAAPTDDPLTIKADADALVQAVAATRSPGMRLRARLWPRSGVEQLNAWSTQATERLLQPGRQLGSLRTLRARRGLR